ncbi:MAG: transketolase [Oscillospiraceae bacterium]|jgi:transketolase|nr:transketolase [Oscillospiraceae bacterium]
MRNEFVEELCYLAKNDKDIILITGDLGFGVLNKFWDLYPKQFINSGICEQAMTSFASGMAVEGKTVFTYSIGNFPTLRCLEQVRNDICYTKANIKIVSIGTGFAYGTHGISHHTTEDIAIMRALPEMRIFSPCDPVEAVVATREAYEHKGPCYIRLGKGGEPTLNKSSVLSCKEAILLKDGKKTAILATGSIVGEALLSAEHLQKSNIDCAVYSFPMIKPIDISSVNYILNKYEYIFTLEEHTIIGGFGSTIAEIAAQNTNSSQVIRLGINDTFCSEVGSQAYLRSFCGIDAEHITKRIVDRVKSK